MYFFQLVINFLCYLTICRLGYIDMISRKYFFKIKPNLYKALVSAPPPSTQPKIKK
jgi:hypothetical protein